MSAFVCEPDKDGVKLVERIAEKNPRRVLLIFWHGVGDLVMFLPVFEAVKLAYPEIRFALGVPLGLSYCDLVPDALELTGEETNDTTAGLPFDLVAKITFPMNEGQNVYTKGEFCLLHEIGPLPGRAEGPLNRSHGRIATHPTRLVPVHFNITCLPDSCNPDAETAERVWNDVLGAGFVPLECHFQHIFHNPVNVKFPFIDATVRRCRPELASLIGLLSRARAFVGVVSGPFHVALSVLGPERVLLLEKDFKKEHFTRLPIRSANLRDYKNEVAAFLKEVS